MIENSKVKLSNQRQSIHLLIGVLIFGSMWGLLEATLGGFLHLIIFPNKGAIMSSIGVAIMAAALAVYRKPAVSIGIGIIAASFKLLDVLIFALPVNSYHIVNPAMAIIFESLAFSLIAAFLMDKIAKNAFAGIGAGVLVGLISAIAYIHFALLVTPAEVVARQGVKTASQFIINQGVVQAAFCGILLPLGYLAGEKLAARVSLISLKAPLYYASSAIVICLCWSISAIVRIAGL